MLELRLRDVSILKKVMDALKGLFVDVNFECLVDGLFLATGVDSGLTMTLFLKSDGFEHYIFDKNTTISIDVPTMVRLLKGCSDEIISIEADDKKGTVKVTMVDPSGIGKLEYERRQMNIPTVPIEIPRVEFHAIAHLSSIKFGKICNNLSKTVKCGGTSVTISVTTDKVEISNKWSGGGSTLIIKQHIDGEPYDRTEIWMAQPEQEQVVSSTFSLRYFDYISKVAPPSSRVSVCFSKDGVIVIEYEVLEMAQMRFYLAPMVSE